jgi:dihydrodipicolinate synthase/N-acetylneuraminate lyase
VHPAHALAVWDLIQAGQYDEGQHLYESVQKPLGEFSGRSAAKSGGYRVLKGLMAAIGKSVGPPRPPTLPLDDDELAEARALVERFGWPTA